MARVMAHAGSQISYAGGVVQTLVQLKAPANQKIVIKEVGISFAGTSVTGTPLDVQLLFQANGGTMTNLPPTHLDSSDATSIQTTGQSNATSEPAPGNEAKRWNVHPQTGIVWQAQVYQDEVIVAGGGYIGLRIASTSGQAVVESAYIDFEE